MIGQVLHVWFVLSKEKSSVDVIIWFMPSKIYVWYWRYNASYFCHRNYFNDFVPEPLFTAGLHLVATRRLYLKTDTHDRCRQAEPRASKHYRLQLVNFDFATQSYSYMYEHCLKKYGGGGCPFWKTENYQTFKLYFKVSPVTSTPST